jgi:hypothetical protein
MVGTCVSGIRSTGNRVSEMLPSKMMTPEIMNIVTGRSIASLGILISASQKVGSSRFAVRRTAVRLQF